MLSIMGGRVCRVCRRSKLIPNGTDARGKLIWFCPKCGWRKLHSFDKKCPSGVYEKW